MPAVTRLLLEDQKPFGFHNSETIKRMDIVWSVFNKFKVDDGKVFRFFEHKDITSDNPEIKITYYSCPDNKFVAIVGNTSAKEIKGKIDFSKVKANISSVTDEISGNEWITDKGKISVNIPAMDFVILTF